MSIEALYTWWASPASSPPALASVVAVEQPDASVAPVVTAAKTPLEEEEEVQEVRTCGHRPPVFFDFQTVCQALNGVWLNEVLPLPAPLCV